MKPFFALMLVVLLSSSLAEAAEKTVLMLPIASANNQLGSGLGFVDKSIRGSAKNALKHAGCKVLGMLDGTSLVEHRGFNWSKGMFEPKVAIEAGRRIDATLVLFVRIDAKDGSNVGTIRLFDVATERQLASTEIVGRDVDELRASWKQLKKQFFADAMPGAAQVDTADDEAELDEPPQAKAQTEMAAPAPDDGDDADEDGQPEHRKHTGKGEGRKESQRLRRLCDKGDGAACVQRGRMYESGDGILRRNYGEALGLYLDGCKLGVQDGCAAAKALVHSQDTAHRYAEIGCERGNQLECDALK